MKKLLLVLTVIVFIGNITGQTTIQTSTETSIPSINPDLEEYIIKDNVCIYNPISVITITKADIRTVPVTTCESDIVTTLLTTTCAGPINFEENIENSITAETTTGPVTGLEGHNFIEDPAIIYPNPVRDVMNIKSTDPITVIEILGINGQVVVELDPRITMDVSGLAAGTYYARIHFENIKDVQVEKICIVK